MTIRLQSLAADVPVVLQHILMQSIADPVGLLG